MTRPSAIQRFASYIARDSNGCWRWKGSLSNGYATFHHKDKTYRGHKWAYENLVGPVPDGLQLDHLCRVRDCVNPLHLEVVTQQENIARGEAGINLRVKTTCPKGHPYSGDNLYVRPSSGCRICKACRRESDNRRLAQKNKTRRARRAAARRLLLSPTPEPTNDTERTR